jgi:hypothetical protein
MDTMNGPCFGTWFGHPGVNVVGRYIKGKFMRLDYFLLSGGLHERAEQCVHASDGYGEVGFGDSAEC